MGASRKGWKLKWKSLFTLLLLIGAWNNVFEWEEKGWFFKEYDAKTEELVKQGEITEEVANFLYQTDCEGKIDRKQAKEIYELIKDCDDNMIFGYTGRSNCAKMSDLKKIFSDKTKIEWR